MNLRRRSLALGTAIALGLLPLGAAAPRVRTAADHPPPSGSVVHVYDGDTIGVKFEGGPVRKVRLIGVDTPERDAPTESQRYWAEMAARFVIHTLWGKDVRLEYDREPEDKYGRVLAYVRLGSSGLFNEILIREGYSAAYLVFPFREDYRAAFRRAEVEAREAGRGMWRTREPEPRGEEEAPSHLGEYTAVRFRCGRVVKGRSYYFLWSESRRLQALVSIRGVVNRLAGGDAFAGREVAVTGILEGRPELMKIYALFPSQIKVL